MSITVFLLLQTQVIAAAAAGVAAEGLSPKDARAEAENAAQLSVALVENAIVILMLVEDHLRLQSKLSCSSCAADGYKSPLSLSHLSSSQSAPKPWIWIQPLSFYSQSQQQHSAYLKYNLYFDASTSI